MLFKNVASQGIHVYAYDSTTGAAKTGDAANITAYVSLDGTANVLDDTNPAEVDATNLPGVYYFTLDQAETNCNSFALYAKSATANIRIEPIIGFTTGAANALSVNTGTVTDDAITAAAIAAGALNGKGDWNVGKTGYTLTATTGLGNQTANITGNLSGSVGSVTGAVGSVTGAVGSVTGSVGSVAGAVASVTAGVTVSTNNDKAGYSLTATTGLGNQTSNITGTVSGNSTHSAADVVTAMGTGSTLTALAPSATALSTAVWTNTKAGYIDVAISSVGGGTLTAASIADAVWDEIATGHLDAGKAGAQLWTAINAISGSAAINITSTSTTIESE